MTLLVYSFDISLYMYLVLHSLSNIDDFAESLCWFLLITVVCVKLTNLLIHRDEIIDMMEMLENNYFLPRDNAEETIQKNYDYLARRNTRLFLIVSVCTMTAVTFGGMMKGKDVVLPFKTSLPYDSNCTFTFWLTYVCQALSLWSSGFVGVGNETFIMTMMLQICSQLEIIYHRLENLPILSEKTERSLIFTKTEEARILVDCVKHHNYIYQ